MKTISNNKNLLIYNPNAGKKRKSLNPGNGISLEDIKRLLDQYQIPVDYAPTKGPKHATLLAKDGSKAGYDTIIVAGGDGTINEAANGLVGTQTPLGIIPMGTFMNIARMLSIPLDIEKAILLLKLKRVRKIDVGEVTKIEGEKLSEPFYFLESSGIGIDAHIQEHFKKIESGKLQYIFLMVKKFFDFSIGTTEITTDEKTVTFKAPLINIANGPYAGANLKISPNAKLNDHLLTVSIYPMSRFELIKYFLRMKIKDKTDLRRVHTLSSTNIKVKAESTEMLVHIDASMFGYPPVNYKIRPNALHVICGYPPDHKDDSLKTRTIIAA